MSPDGVACARIGIVDYGMGNRRSVEKAFAHVGARPVLSADHAALRATDGMVVPGVGAFPAAMRALGAAGLDELVRERAADGVPVIGLCLGMQLLFERSAEHEGADGLGLLPGRVVRLDAGGERMPHIGWNLVTLRDRTPLVDGLPDACAFYHVHSYVAEPAEPADVLGTGEYGRAFPSIVQRGVVAGAQFHPEKSSIHGLALLRNFAAICAARTAAIGAGGAR